MIRFETQFITREEAEKLYPSDEFGCRQARRFHMRKGYVRESLHLYRPTRETARFWQWKKDQMPFWYLNLKADARRRQSAQFERTHMVWHKAQATVRLGCYYERRAAGLT